MDFDMLINKAPFTDTPTPWHQDAAYWIDMPDKRAASCWLALDEATVENGCMWYIPASHLKPIRPHRFAGKQGGALTCDASETEGAAVELLAGSCVFHHGMTLHYSRGNTTKSQRRAFIVNFRPDAMIELERQKGFDHGRSGGAADRKVRSDEFK
jgi:ectoine hydroxylase-related dioxygenase (phytanoyl-CoA dioxygenase family)